LVLAYHSVEVNSRFPIGKRIVAVGTSFEREIGAFVRERRKAGRLSQRELGDLAGVGTRFISELERNKPTLRLDTVNKVLAVFGKTLGIIEATKRDELS
jgi:y4mF family transcriptional regulator